MKKVQVKAEMVLHTIIGEYDILYAQERELRGAFPDKPSEILSISTDPAAHLGETSLPPAEAVSGIFPAVKFHEKGKSNDHT